MRVLWFTNLLLPEACQALGRPVDGSTGWWMSALLERIKARRDLKIAVVASAGAHDAHFEKDGVEFFVVKTPWRRALWSRLGSYRERLPIRRQLVRYAGMIEAWKPDVVHVHGTESEFGLIKAWGLSNAPFAISLQGLMTPCARRAYGDLLPAEIHGFLRGLPGVSTVCHERWKSFRARAPYEEAMLCAADTVIGRTEWDRAWATAYCPDVRYRRVDEILRPQFHGTEPWSAEECRPRQIFTVAGCEPLKGLHVLVEAAYRLKPLFPGLAVNVAGAGFLPRPANDYARYVLDRIDRCGLESAFTFLGQLDAAALVRQLRRAHCYALPSFMENSSNALQEAMLVGVPCVASTAGGTPSIMVAERSGLAFPAGDAALLAGQIGRILRDERLAKRLSREARAAAAVRNDPARVEAQLLGAYEELAGGCAKRRHA